MTDTIDMEHVLEISSKLSVNKSFLYFIMFTSFTFFVLFLKLKSYSYASLTIYIMLGVFIFITASKKLTQSSESIFLAQPTFSYVCLLIFFINFAFSIAYLIFFESLYSKSLWYYFFIGICTSVLFIASVLIEDDFIKKLLPYLTFLLNLNILFSNFIVFPNGVYSSGDTHYQIYNIILPIVENGYVPSGFTYSFFPIHQILVVSLAKITGIEPVFLYMSVTGLLYAVSALFIYSLTNRAGASRFGITAMLLFITASTTFYHSTHVYQFSYALPLGILLMYITMVLTITDDYGKNRNLLQNRTSWVMIYILAIGIIVWTHQFTSTIIFILIVLSWVTNYVISKNNANTLSFYSVFILYIVILFAHWMYISSVFSSLVRVFDVYCSSLFTVENYQVASSSLNSTNFLRPLWLIFIDTSGRGIIMMLGSMGCLYGIWKKNKYVFIWFIIGAFIWTLTSFGSFIKMPLLLGSRLLTFFDAMSIVFLATFGIMFLIERFGTKGLIFCSILLLIIPVFSLGSTVSGSETSLFVGDQPYVKFYDTDSDLQYRTWIKNTVPGNSNIWVSESWVLQYLDDLRVYGQLPINDQDQVADNMLKIGEYTVLNKHDSIGLRVKGISERDQIELVRSKNMSTIESQASHVRITKLDISEIKRVTSQLEHIYSNGETNICLKWERRKSLD